MVLSTTLTSISFWIIKITADGDCTHEIKRHLLLGRKAMTNLLLLLLLLLLSRSSHVRLCATPWTAAYLDSILKSRDIALPTEVRLVKAMVFPVVMYGCESWTIRKAEH